MSRADGERCSAFFSCTVVGPHHTHVNEIGAAWCCDGEPERIARPAAPAAEADLRATLARVEALILQWETRDVRLSRRFAANELRRALDGTDG